MSKWITLCALTLVGMALPGCGDLTVNQPARQPAIIIEEKKSAPVIIEKTVEKPVIIEKTTVVKPVIIEKH